MSRRSIFALRSMLAALAALTLANCDHATAAQGPSDAVVKAAIQKPFGAPSPDTIFQYQSIQVAKPRVLHVDEVLGIPGGTTVWPVLVKYTIWSHWGDKPNDSCSRTDQSQFYYFFKNEFGDWGSGNYANSENHTTKSRPYYPCSTMPGSEIFSQHH